MMNNTDYSPGKKIVILLLILGILMTVMGYWKYEDYKVHPNVVYKYIPKSYYDELYINTPIYKLFGKMFNSACPWVKAKPGYDPKPNIPYFFNHFAKNVTAYDNQDFYQDY